MRSKTTGSFQGLENCIDGPKARGVLRRHQPRIAEQDL
jgi:hypothetical protein